MGISLLSTKFFAVRTLKYAGQRQQAVSNVTGQVEEAYSGRMIVKAFNLENKVQQISIRQTRNWRKLLEGLILR